MSITIMATAVLNIGELHIPAVILSKPTKLSDIEDSMLKEHPMVGAEILKNAESPRPLAEIIHQHHERMNGSSYPRKPKDDDLLVEAKIPAVFEGWRTVPVFLPGGSAGLEDPAENVL